MKKNKGDQGFFLTIEGGEGTGKSTLIDSLYHFLKEEGREVVKSFEPGGTELGQKIRDVLLMQKTISIAPRSELLLFLADRAHHVESLIKPALEEDKVVLCDRFTDSSIAYQGAARKLILDKEDLYTTCLFATDGLIPDLTFYLDLDPEVGLARIAGNKDRLESEEIAFHKRVREGYLELMRSSPNRIFLLDANRPPAEVFEKAKNKLLEVMKKFHVST